MRRGCPACQKDIDVKTFVEDDVELIETFLSHLPFCTVHKRQMDKIIEEKEY